MEIKKKKVLVVDDDNNLRDVLVEKFNLSGFDASGARDGVEGLAVALATHPDVILLDVMMPRLGGMGALKKLREDSWGKQAKVIMLTSLEDANFIAEAMEKGSFTYLVKTQHPLGDVVLKVEEELRR
jgi:DNA-binding response OmpR family regulator